MTFCLAEKYRLGKYGNARLEVKKGRFGLTYKNLEERKKEALSLLLGRESLLCCLSFKKGLLLCDRSAFAFNCCICNVCDKLWKNHHGSEKWFQKWKTIENFGCFSSHFIFHFNQYFHSKFTSQDLKWYVKSKLFRFMWIADQFKMLLQFLWSVLVCSSSWQLVPVSLCLSFINFGRKFQHSVVVLF